MFRPQPWGIIFCSTKRRILDPPQGAFLTGTDHWNSRLSKTIQVEKTTFFNISENLQENQQKYYISGYLHNFSVP